MRQDAEQPFFQMSGVSKSYGGAVALDHAELAVRRGRIHAVLGENGAGKSTLLKVMSGVVQPDEGTMHLDGRRSLVRVARRGERGRHRLRVSGAVADPRPERGGQHLRFEPATALRHDRSPGPAPPGRGRARPRGRGRHQSARESPRPAAVAPADGRTREGTGARAAHPDPRRGHVGADRGRRGARHRRAQAPARRRARAALHLAPDARGEGARGRMHRLPERSSRNELRGGHALRQRGRRNDDRPQVPACVSRQARERARANAAPPNRFSPAATSRGTTRCAASAFR